MAKKGVGEMEKRQRIEFAGLPKSKRFLIVINYLLTAGFALTTFGLLISSFVVGDPNNRFVSWVMTIVCYILPILIQIIFRIRLAPTLHFIYIIFLTFSAFYGSCLNLTHTIPYIDKIQHFIWGYISCLIGLYYICRTREIDLMKTLTIILLFFSISIATAGIWEVIEFVADNVFGQTAQGVPIDGVVSVDDSMFDIIVHLFGSLLFVVHYCIDRVLHKNLGITLIINDFKTGNK